VEIARGLRAGERVVVGGIQQLGDTTAVRVVRDSAGGRDGEGGSDAQPGRDVPVSAARGSR
jgi:hypothetical protein